MIYILGYRPDEFGLIPDPDGYVSFKELLRAIHEEPDWGYIRQNHFNEILMGNARSLFEWDNKRIRALKREWKLDLKAHPDVLPKILFIAVRRRAHPQIMGNGLKTNPDKYLPLSPEKEMAIRIGRRRDQNPVLLDIMALQAGKGGIPFYPFGHLLLAKEIPANYISGPPVSRDEGRGPEQGKKRIEKRPLNFEAGSFLLDLNRWSVPQNRPPVLQPGHPASQSQKKGKKQKGWKEDARKLRRKRGR